MLTRDELEGKLEAFRSEMRREMRDKSEDAFEKLRDEMLREHDKSRIPAKKALVRMRERPEYIKAWPDEDYEWMFRDGVRWFKQKVLEKAKTWNDIALICFRETEKEGTA